eukprot:366103-Chlamydomonas_euryale.AAC.3
MPTPTPAHTHQLALRHRLGAFAVERAGLAHAHTHPSPHPPAFPSAQAGRLCGGTRPARWAPAATCCRSCRQTQNQSCADGAQSEWHTGQLTLRGYGDVAGAQQSCWVWHRHRQSEGGDLRTATPGPKAWQHVRLAEQAVAAGAAPSLSRSPPPGALSPPATACLSA